MGQSKTETTTANRNPWQQTIPGLETAVGAATNAMGNTSLFTPSRGLGTEAGINQLLTYGGSPTATQGAAGVVTQGSGQGYNAGLGTLMRTATGSVDPRQNPALMDALRAANQTTAEKVNSQFSGAGRYGSGANTLALARALNETNTAALMGQYNTNVTNQQNAASQLMQGGFQGVSAAQASDAARLAQANATLQAGQLQDSYNDASKQAPLRSAEWGSGLLSPIAQLGGTQDATTTQRSNPSIGGMIGGGLMTGLGLLTSPIAGSSVLGGMIGNGFGGGSSSMTSPLSWIPTVTRGS